jgi:hypothetical protein
MTRIEQSQTENSQNITWNVKFIEAFHTCTPRGFSNRRQLTGVNEQAEGLPAAALGAAHRISPTPATSSLLLTSSFSNPRSFLVL